MNLKKLFNNNLEKQFQQVIKAEEYQPLPTGSYEVRAVGGELLENINATEFYRVRFVIVTGPHTGRHVHHQIWLTEKSLPYAKRDLEVLGIYSLGELDGWEPDNTVYKVVLTQNTSTSGVVFNKVFSVSRKDGAGSNVDINNVDKEI